MLPLSLGRVSSLGSHRKDTHRSLAWLRPANIAAVSRAELLVLTSWLAACVAVGVVIGLGHVWLRLKVVDLGYRLSATHQLIDKLRQEGHELTIEAVALDAPGHLQELARGRLAMSPPEKGREAVLP